MIRSVKAAIFSSWVTTTTVAPALWSSEKISMISMEAAVSRFPVGSSAKISGGSLARALAMATLCLWPPDISLGMWSALAPRPTHSRSSMARSARFLLGIRA